MLKKMELYSSYLRRMKAKERSSQVELILSTEGKRNIEYEDNDSTNIYIDVESSGGTRRVLVDEENLIIELCHPKCLRKDLQTKSNLSVALRSYITGEFITKEDETPPSKQSRKSNPEQKKYKKRKQPEDEEIEYSKEEEELEVVPPGGQMSSSVLSSEQNKI